MPRPSVLDVATDTTGSLERAGYLAAEATLHRIPWTGDPLLPARTQAVVLDRTRQHTLDGEPVVIADFLRNDGVDAKAIVAMRVDDELTYDFGAGGTFVLRRVA